MSSKLREFLTGSTIYTFISKQMGIICVCIVLMIALVWVRYRIENEVRSIDKISNEITVLRRERLKIKTIYQTTTSMSSIDKMLKGIDIGISTEPLKGIIIYQEEPKDTEQGK